jgi:hypothetical protein
MESVIAAVREGWMDAGRDGWMGDTGKSVIWLGKEERQGTELDLVGIGSRFAPAEEVDSDEELCLSSKDNGPEHVKLEELFHRVVLNPTEEFKILRAKVPPPTAGTSSSTAATIVLPPSSGFLLSQFNTWSAPSSGLAALGSKLGSWDLLLLEFVLRSLPLPVLLDSFG